MPAGAAARQNQQADCRTNPIAIPASVCYGTIEYRTLLLNVFSVPEGWRIAVTKAAYPFRELHATADRTMDVAIEAAKLWVNRAKLRYPTRR